MPIQTSRGAVGHWTWVETGHKAEKKGEVILQCHLQKLFHHCLYFEHIMGNFSSYSWQNICLLEYHWAISESGNPPPPQKDTKNPFSASILPAYRGVQVASSPFIYNAQTHKHTAEVKLKKGTEISLKWTSSSPSLTIWSCSLINCTKRFTYEEPQKQELLLIRWNLVVIQTCKHYKRKKKKINYIHTI